MTVKFSNRRISLKPVQYREGFWRHPKICLKRRTPCAATSYGAQCHRHCSTLIPRPQAQQTVVIKCELPSPTPEILTETSGTAPPRCGGVVSPRSSRSRALEDAHRCRKPGSAEHQSAHHAGCPRARTSGSANSLGLPKERQQTSSSRGELPSGRPSRGLSEYVDGEVNKERH